MPPDPGAPKLSIEKFADGGIACLKFAGTIDESFEGKKLGATATGETLVLDLGGVKKISSFGIREWVDFMQAASARVKSIVLVECTPKVVDQLNMVGNFAGGGRVFSFYAPFRCDYCNSEHRVLLQVDKDREAIKGMKLADRPCLTCREAMYFDEDGPSYFSYLAGQEPFELAPEVAGFLATRLSYVVGELSRKLRVDKIIEGRVTYVRLAGDFDENFPREKLAEGLEGTVLVDLGSLGRIEPAGAAAWRAFVQQVTPVVDAIAIAAAPPGFVERLCTREDLGAKAQLLSLTLPYQCRSCGATSGQLVDVAEHHAILKFATAPELPCGSCQRPLTCVAAEPLMTALATLPKPTVDATLGKLVGILRERAIAQQRRPSAKTPLLVPSAAAPPQKTSLAVPVLAGLVAVVLAAGGYLLYQRLTATATPTGAVVNRSAPVAPAWATPGTRCTASAAGLSCVGVSALSAREDEAESDASDAAYDVVASAIAERIKDSAWRAAVPPIWRSARDAKLAAYEHDQASSAALREAREARHAVAAALHDAIPSAAVERYWEEYDTHRTRAWATVTIGAADVARLVGQYAHATGALGATAVSAFPLVGWRFSYVGRGAVITALAPGPLQDLGLAAGYIVLSIDGRDVPDAAAFAQIATDEYTQLSERGGTLRLKVQAADGVPREFSASVKAPDATTTPATVHHPVGSGAPVSAPPTGGVNVWDRYGGNRNDPAQ
ncbi:MAG TPA: hypothetical protein VGM88_23875 [Kofleriaceae bacterium]|jgi:anti-anti-sigma regulatory factor